MKIGIGTAQFGMPYGISNANGVPDEGEVRQIFSMARARGVRLIDTATLYGSSEEAIGAALPSHDGFDVVTKVSGEEPRRAFEGSLRRLRASNVYGLLAHDADDLLGPRGESFYEALCAIKKEKLVRKIGVSLYTGEQIDAILSRYDIDLVQVPLSVLDQRLIQSGHLRALKDRGVEIHVRSVFLQGLLLMPPEKIPASLKSACEPLKKVWTRFEREGLDIISGALGFAVGVPEVDRVVVGVSCAAELEQILDASERATKLDVKSFADLACEDTRLLNPALWGA